MMMFFEYRKKIYGYECDIYGHLNNANYQNIYEAARSDMLDEIGLPIDGLVGQGIHIYVKKITIEYFKGIPIGSDITVKSCIHNVNRVRSIWIQEIWSSEQELMNKATVEGVFVKAGKPHRIGDEHFEKLLNTM